MAKKLIIICLVILVMLLGVYFIFIHKSDNNNEKTKDDELIEIDLEDISPFRDKITEQTKDKAHLPQGTELSGYGVRMFDQNGDYMSETKIKITDNTEKLYISFINANSTSDKINFLLFIDGELMEYHLDGNPQSQLYYSIEMTPYSMINFPIEFTLDTLNRDFVHNLHAVFLYNMDEVSKEDYIIIYFAASIRKQIYFSEINKSLDNNKSEIINEDTISADSGIANSNDFLTLINTKETKDFSYQRITFEAKINEYVDFNLKSFFKENKLRATSIFFNNELITLENKKTMIWESSEDKMLSKDFKIKMPEKPGNYFIYAITLPLDDSPFYEYFTSYKININVIDD